MMSGNIFEPETLLISGIHLVLLGLELCAVDSNLGHLFPVNFFDYVYSPVWKVSWEDTY